MPRPRQRRQRCSTCRNGQRQAGACAECTSRRVRASCRSLGGSSAATRAFWCPRGVAHRCFRRGKERPRRMRRCNGPHTPDHLCPMRLATCACDVNHANPQSTTWSVHDAVAHRRSRPQAAAAAAEAQRLEAEENAEKLAAAQAELEAAKHALPERASAAAAGDIAWTTCNTDHAGRTAQRTTQITRPHNRHPRHVQTHTIQHAPHRSAHAELEASRNAA